MNVELVCDYVVGQHYLSGMFEVSSRTPQLWLGGVDKRVLPYWLDQMWLTARYEDLTYSAGMEGDF